MAEMQIMVSDDAEIKKQIIMLLNDMGIDVDVVEDGTTFEENALKKAREILDEDHYALDKLKERIVEYMSALKLNPDMKNQIICFVGPP